MHIQQLINTYFITSIVKERGQGERETWTGKRGRRVREAGMDKMKERERTF